MDDPIPTMEEREAINHGRWFSSLSPSLRHDILRCASVKRHPDGEPGIWFGDVAIIDGDRRTHDGHAHGATTIVGVSRADFHNQELKAMEREGVIRIEAAGLVVCERDALLRIGCENRP